MENIAIIDLGTNTFNLLIASHTGKAVYNEKIAVKLGKGGISKGVITPDAFERAIKALSNYKEKAIAYNCERIIAIATSAVRNAKNGQLLVQVAADKCGIDIQVISGNEEAELIYFGVRSALSLGNNPALIMDIGGGSVEFIIANDSKIFWKQSFEIGAQRLLDKFQTSDPISPDQIKNLNFFLEQHLPPLLSAIKKYKPETLVGSSGTFDTLAEIDIIRKDLGIDYSEATEYDLPVTDHFLISKEIISKERKERMSIPGMIEMRVDMIVVACILIDFVVHNLHTPLIRISSYALKEGVLYKALHS